MQDGRNPVHPFSRHNENCLLLHQPTHLGKRDSPTDRGMWSSGMTPL